MKGRKGSQSNSFIPAVEAIQNLARQDLTDVFNRGTRGAMMAHPEIKAAPTRGKTMHFYRYLVPWRSELVSVLVNSYRRYFKLALVHLHQGGQDPHRWACVQLQPAVSVALESICDWYILACDGENQYVRRGGTVPFVPGKTASSAIPLTPPPFRSASWRAPAWLFQVSLALFGIEAMKPEHIPATDSEEKLGAGHTRVLLRGARRVFLWDLRAVIERARNEEIAAAGTVRAEGVTEQKRAPNKRKGWQQRLRLYQIIKTVLSANPGLQGMKFCAELDRRHAQPLFDWQKSGEWRKGLLWKDAWRVTSLQRKIRRVRQEAQKRG